MREEKGSKTSTVCFSKLYIITMSFDFFKVCSRKGEGAPMKSMHCIFVKMTKKDDHFQDFYYRGKRTSM